VYSDRIYKFISKAIPKKDKTNKTFPEWKGVNSKIISLEYILNIKLELQILMQKKVGIVRNDIDLLNAKKQLENWKSKCYEMQNNHKINKDFYELKNMIDVSLLIVEQSLARKENRGGFVKI